MLSWGKVMAINSKSLNPNCNSSLAIEFLNMNAVMPVREIRRRLHHQQIAVHRITVSVVGNQHDNNLEDFVHGSSVQTALS